MIIIDYDLLKIACQEKGLYVLESTYLGDGILGKFFEPNIILININLCNKCNEKQKKILVLLHEMCHWFKWQEHKENHIQHDEEACFEYENICDIILNDEYSINYNFEAIKRLNLYNPINFLKKIIEKCKSIEKMKKKLI